VRATAERNTGGLWEFQRQTHLLPVNENTLSLARKIAKLVPMAAAETHPHNSRLKYLV
jgi:hypothetical protein